METIAAAATVGILLVEATTLDIDRTSVLFDAEAHAVSVAVPKKHLTYEHNRTSCVEL